MPRNWQHGQRFIRFRVYKIRKLRPIKVVEIKQFFRDWGLEIGLFATAN
jgi:hypothetical protein